MAAQGSEGRYRPAAAETIGIDAERLARNEYGRYQGDRGRRSFGRCTIENQWPMR